VGPVAPAVSEGTTGLGAGRRFLVLATVDFAGLQSDFGLEPVGEPWGHGAVVAAEDCDELVD